ncbi:protein of unknown function [Methanoculleus bourgensis]|uniref:Uncharacterized protein n=1 Tax=Methanoculleus bourgensis TaxID=83986 RepID=A0A0X3BN60_9EURY|nr:protein of unknown function [Methanoculleus bourgensis]
MVPQLLSGYRGKRGSRESGMPHVRLDLRPHPGLPLASFAVSRDFLVLGEQCLTRRARSREGCSVPSRSLFALFAASREPSVQGENNVSREGREAAKVVAFPPVPSSRSSREPSVQGGDNISREEREAAKDAASPSFPPSRLPRASV